MKLKGHVKMFFFWFHSFFLFFFRIHGTDMDILGIFLINISILKEILFIHFLLVVLMVSTMDCRSIGGGSIPSGEIFVFIYVFGKLAESGFKVVVWSAIDTISVSAGSNPALAVNYFFLFYYIFLSLQP